MIVEQATQVGNPLIRAKAVAVPDVTAKAVQKIIDGLVDSMRFHELVGMAAPQIGKSLRIFVTEIRITKLRKADDASIDGLRVFINPTIVSCSAKEIKGWEGCGSVANSGLFGMVKRPTSLVISAQDRTGEPFQMKASGLLARIIQHEMDHLNGRVFTDVADSRTYMSKNEYLKMRAR
jgi:peptide deformylase